MKVLTKSGVFELIQRLAVAKYSGSGMTSEQCVEKLWCSGGEDAQIAKTAWNSAADDPPRPAEKQVFKATDAYRQMETLADELVRKGKVATRQQGIAKVAVDRRDLYPAHLQQSN